MKKVLIVDDEKDFCFFTKKYLEKKEAFEVRICTKPRQAIQLIEEFTPDVILLDILMPEVSGLTLAANLACSKELSRIPVIFVTAVISTEELTKARHLIGSHPVIRKPIKMEQLIHTIHSLTE